MVTLSPEELTKLSNLWEHHKQRCAHKGDIHIEHSSGGGIGTVTKATCGCGEVFDITNYFDW
jgi:hypothetical protein